MEKYATPGQATDENMTHTHCMLDNHGYIHILRISNTAFVRQQWLHEHTSVIWYMYIACLVYFTMQVYQNVDLGRVCKEAVQVLSQYLSGVTAKYTLTDTPQDSRCAPY